LTGPLRLVNAQGDRIGAPFINAEHVSEIPPSACRGCGICVCECPAQAIILRHTRDEQLNAAIDGLLEQSLGRG